MEDAMDALRFTVDRDEEAGVFMRQGRGDREICYSPISKRPFAVDSKIRSRHSTSGVLKDAGLKKAF
jgi:hypothetical protein